jgi:hypothetical protein
MSTRCNRRKQAVFSVAACLAEVVAGSDSRLWYDRPAEIWVEALPIGNGRLGAMVRIHRRAKSQAYLNCANYNRLG